MVLLQFETQHQKISRENVTHTHGKVCPLKVPGICGTWDVYFRMAHVSSRLTIFSLMPMVSLPIHLFLHLTSSTVSFTPFIWSHKSLILSAFHPMYTKYLFRSESFYCIMILFNSAFGCRLLVHFLTLQGAYFVIYKRDLQHHMTIAWAIDNPQQISFLTFLWLPVIIFFDGC